MRIAFVGAQGTGKTTLVNNLAGPHIRADRPYVYQEVVRDLMRNRKIN